MHSDDWLLLAIIAGWAVAGGIAFCAFAALFGRLNAPQDDDPPTIIARPPMNSDDGEW